MRQMPWRSWSVGRRVAAACLSGALVVDVAVLLQLLQRGGPGDESGSGPIQLPNVPVIVRRAPNDAALLIEAGRRAPFGGTAEVALEGGMSGVVQQTMSEVPDRPRLVGTVVEGDGRGFVVVELPDARMQLVRVGERAGPWRLRSVAAGAAVFEDARGDRISLRSPQAGAGSQP